MSEGCQEQQPVAVVREVVLFQPVCEGPHMLSGAWSGPHFTFKSEAERWARAHDESEHPPWLTDDDNGSRCAMCGRQANDRLHTDLSLGEAHQFMTNNSSSSEGPDAER
jgi:hypothetical protein